MNRVRVAEPWVELGRVEGCAVHYDGVGQALVIPVLHGLEPDSFMLGGNIDVDPAELERRIIETLGENPLLFGKIDTLEIFYNETPLLIEASVPARYFLLAYLRPPDGPLRDEVRGVQATQRLFERSGLEGNMMSVAVCFPGSEHLLEDTPYTKEQATYHYIRLRIAPSL